MPMRINPYKGLTVPDAAGDGTRTVASPNPVSSVFLGFVKFSSLSL